jgi:hypothetical protein
VCHASEAEQSALPQPKHSRKCETKKDFSQPNIYATNQNLIPINPMKPSTYELMDCYRTWWQTSYGNPPNSQATIIAAAFAEHVLELFAKQADEEPNGNS